MRALLDVNVLIALLDADHAHHRIASRWLNDNIQHGWASCAIIQNGCVRILSQPRYPNALPMGQVVSRLREACATRYHEFWPDTVSLLDPDVIDHTRLISPKQITDVYLLALAAQHGARFVTFDRAIPYAASRLAGAETLLVI